MSKDLKLWPMYMAASVGAGISLGLLSIGEYTHLKQTEKSTDYPSIKYNNTGVIEVFEPEQHVVLESVDSPLDEIKQYNPHPGYKPVGFTTATYGVNKIKDSGTCIMYINDEQVQAMANGTIDDEYYFGDFGIPVDYQIKSSITDDGMIEYQPGEHILSVPIASPLKYDFNYESHDGYEPVGIASASHGDDHDISSGAAILYVNVEPVVCEKSNDKDYIDFGTPKEIQKTLIKK